MFKKIVPALVVGTVLAATPIMASAEYEYGYSNNNELVVIAKDHQAYMYMTYDANGNLVDVEYCQAPSNLTSSYVSGSGYVLNWAAVPGAKYYRVYENGTALSQTYTTNSAAIGTIAPNANNTYNFYVTAVYGDSSTEGAPSNTISFLPPTTFVSPITTTTHTATLTWSPVAGATGYYVYADGVQMQSTTGTTVTLQNLTAGHNYTFEVTAYNAQSNGVQASEMMSTIAVPVVKTSNLSTSKVTLSWYALANATSYNVYLNGTKVANGITTTSYLYSGTLSSSASNSFTVSAIYPTGEGEQSAPATILPATTITSSTAADTTAVLNWNAVQGASGYTVQLVPTAGGTTISQTVTGTTATFSNLTKSTSYNATVYPMSGTTQGFPSNTYPVTTLAAYYTTPTSVKATPITTSSGKLNPTTYYNGVTMISWSAPATADSSTTYIVYQTDVNGNILSTLATGVTGTNTNINVPASTTMSVDVAAVTEGVQTSNSPVCTFTTPPASSGDPVTGGL